ncbi:MAG: hypothetical protein ACTSQY_06645 [Candidatus Odinarchaeia archaeon]
MSKINKLIRKPKLRLSKPRLKLPKAPSKNFWYTIILFIVYFSLAGGAYIIVKQPPTIGADQAGNPVVIFTRSLGGGLDEQFVLEAILASLLMFLGFIGFISVYESTKHIYTPNYAYVLLIAGIVMIIMAAVGLQGLITVKLS